MAKRSSKKLLIAQKPDGTIVEVRASEKQAEIKRAFFEGAGYEVEIFDLPEEATVEGEELEEPRVPPGIGATAAMVWAAIGFAVVVGAIAGGLILVREVNHRFGIWGALIFLGAGMLTFWWGALYVILKRGTKAQRGSPRSHSHQSRRLGGGGAQGYMVRRGLFKGIR